MNFNGIGKFLAIVFVAMGIVVTIPAVVSYFFATSPFLGLGIAVLCGALGGRMISPVKWPVCLGSAAAAASLTISCAITNFGGGVTGWILGMVCAVAAATATTVVLLMLLPKAKKTPRKL